MCGLSQTVSGNGLQEGKKMSFDNVPLSESSITVKLVEIQKRCSDLINEPEIDTGGLSLEDTCSIEFDDNCPYSRG